MGDNRRETPSCSATSLAALPTAGGSGGSFTTSSPQLASASSEPERRARRSQLHDEPHTATRVAQHEPVVGAIALQHEGQLGIGARHERSRAGPDAGDPDRHARHQIHVHVGVELIVRGARFAADLQPIQRLVEDRQLEALVDRVVGVQPLEGCYGRDEGLVVADRVRLGRVAIDAKAGVQAVGRGVATIGVLGLRLAIANTCTRRGTTPLSVSIAAGMAPSCVVADSSTSSLGLGSMYS